MEKLVKIGEIEAESLKDKEMFREALENIGFVVAEYPEGCFDNYLIILTKRQ